MNIALFVRMAQQSMCSAAGECVMIPVCRGVSRLSFRTNDTYGHQNGDEYLILIAQNLQASLRGEDFACRMGGDEFAAMLFFDKSVPETTIRARVHQIFDKVNLVV